MRHNIIESRDKREMEEYGRILTDDERNKEFVRQVFDNHANVCLMIEKEYCATMLKDLVNYFKIKYDNKEKHQ